MQHYNEKVLKFSKILGEVVRKIRKEKTSISLNQFAREYDIDRGNLSKLENGVMNCRVVTLYKISQALGVKFSELAAILEENLDSDFSLIED